jgi:hypothetical protein
MDPDKLLETINAICEGLRADMATHCEKLDKKYDAIADALKKKKDSDDDTMAEQTAADSIGRGELAVLARAVSDLQRKANVPVNRDKLAEEQSRCDSVMRTHCERAEAPMSGETNQAYRLRLHQKMQRHSAKWKGVDLRSLENDERVIENVCAEIRADALQAGLNPVEMPRFTEREIVDTSGVHKVVTFVGNGTMFGRMSRPAKKVIGFGGDDRFPKSGGGSFRAAH